MTDRTTSPRPAVGAAAEETRPPDGASETYPALALSDRPADPASRRAALWVLVLWTIGFLAVLPIAKEPVARLSWFLPLTQSVLVVNDLVTACLLLGQMRLTRRWSTLVLASGYLYSALMAGVHLASFPGVFAPGGLIGGGAQTTGYLHVFWHMGLPAAVIAYVLMRRRPASRQMRGGAGIVLAFCLVALLAGALILLAAKGGSLLPVMLKGNQYASTFHIGRYGQWAMTALAIAVLWRSRHRSILDLWLLAMLCATFFELALVSIVNSGRFDVGFYAGRAYAMLASSVVLVMLLIEQGRVYGELADALAAARSEEALRKKKEAELLLIHSAVARQSDILLITEAAGPEGPEWPRIVYVNEAFERRTGHSRAEVIGRTPEFLQGPGTDRQVLCRIRDSLLRREPVRAELLSYAKSGTPLWLELDVAPMFDAAGSSTNYVAVLRDVSARKRAEERAHINEERFRLLARATNDAIWDWDLAANSLWWNDAFEAAFGLLRDAAGPVPESWSSRIHSEDRARVLDGIRRIIDGSGSHWSAEHRFLTAEGAVRDVIDRAFVIRDESGAAVRIVGSMIDVTEQKRLEKQLHQAQRLDAIGQLTGGVAHDFNNLLTVIMGNAELLTQKLERSAALRTLAETTLHASIRGAELTSRLLAFARKQPLHPAATDIGLMLQDMRELLGRTLGGHLSIEVATAADLWPALVDGSQLEAAVLNLAINARDAMPSGGRLAIEARNLSFPDAADGSTPSAEPDLEPGDYVVISVMDAGVGMDEATLARAFEPFFTTKEVGKGSGLGLSMVYGFAKQSQGHVALCSSPGAGTAVHLYLPRARSRPAPDAEVPDSGASLTGHESILLVEDDDLVRGHVSALLLSLGYRVDAVSRPADALDALRSRRYQLLFTDIVMPGGMDGWALAREARQRCPGLRVLLTSGFSDWSGAAATGEDHPHVLRKPYRTQDLAASIRRSLDTGPASDSDLRP